LEGPDTFRGELIAGEGKGGVSPGCWVSYDGTVSVIDATEDSALVGVGATDEGVEGPRTEDADGGGTLVGAGWNGALIGWIDSGDLIGGLGTDLIALVGDELERDSWAGWEGRIFGCVLPPRLGERMVFSIGVSGVSPCITILCD